MKLRRCSRLDPRTGERENELEERVQIVGGVVEAPLGDASAGVGVDDRKLELRLGGVEIDEQAVDLVEHGRDACVGPVDLVDADDRRQPGLERLLEHEAGLRQRPFRSIDQQHDAIDHGERPLDLAAEVGMSGRVDDVDLHSAVLDRRILGEDRDSALALEREGVHYPVHHLLVHAKDPALVEHGIDERGLAVIDVRDDGDVADVAADLSQDRFPGKAATITAGHEEGNRDPPPRVTRLEAEPIEGSEPVESAPGAAASRASDSSRCRAWQEFTAP